MAEYYERGFDFNPGTLGYNLERFDDDVDSYLERASREAAREGTTSMKTDAPWRDRTGDARRGLWMQSIFPDRNSVTLHAGHEVEYGIYLEKGGLAIVMPTLVKVGNALMRSMETMFAMMDSRTATPPVIVEGGDTRPQTENQINRAKRKTRVYFRDAKGRFVSAANTAKTKVTSRTKRTRRK